MICRFEIGDLDFGLGFYTPFLVYDKGGGSLRAFRRAGKREREKGRGKSEEARGKMGE